LGVGARTRAHTQFSGLYPTENERTKLDYSGFTTVRPATV